MTEDPFDAYQSLAEESEDHRWAFGTGFTDPLEGIDTAVPDGVDAGGQAGVHSGQRVGEPGAERPPVAGVGLLADRLVSGVETHLVLRPQAQMCGTESGIS